MLFVGRTHEFPKVAARLHKAFKSASSDQGSILKVYQQIASLNGI